MNDAAKLKTLALALLGSVAGGVIGYFVFRWAARQGFYALMLPGALTGIGGGLVARGKWLPKSVICGVIGLTFGLFSEWQFAPFIGGQSFSYFLAHAHQLRPLTLIMIAGGAALAYWFSLGKALITHN